MSLEKYNTKRDFSSTKEPKGEIKKSENELIFVVHKHAATQLHYDFRLEIDGILKSWAIPKGPSLNPEDKRLAILVEDHPYDYKDFEGIIPEGNYGAGEVIVWDTGTYSLADGDDKTNMESKIKSNLQEGHLSFILKGKKLNGEFALVKFKSLKKNAWLLIKKEDQYASDFDILEKDRSVISNNTLEDLKKSN